MSNKRIFKDFDLPTNHLQGERHYVPARTRDSAELERRHELPKGVLVVEHQRRGLQVAATILKHVQEPEDIVFSQRILAASAVNSAWYGFAKGSEDVMRRRLKLPILANGEQPPTLDTPRLLEYASDDLQDAVEFTDRLIGAMSDRRPRLTNYQKLVGRHIGNASLVLACASLGDQIVGNPAGMSDFDIQHLARQQALRTLHDSRVLGDRIGDYPSLAQLADHDSDLSVFWRRNAPNGALEAYEIATAA